MKEIEIGEYVRLDNGKIGKVKASEKGSIMLDIESDRWFGCCIIVKHSKNIIDLIEVGDYVNGYYVKNKGINGDLIVDNGGYKYLFPIDIKSIVTKEQFEQRQYVLKK